MSWKRATAAVEQPRGAAAPDAAGDRRTARGPIIGWLIGGARHLPDGPSLLATAARLRELFVAQRRTSQEAHP